MSIAENKKAFHDYFIEERFEAGLVLEGWEAKAIRAGRSNLKESYVVLKDGEVCALGKMSTVRVDHEGKPLVIDHETRGRLAGGPSPTP